MTEKTIKVASSLEARPAALFVQAANKFASQVYVELGSKKVNGKSIMGMISIGILEGNSIKLYADGADENMAISELERYFL